MVNLDQGAWVINAILESQFVIFISPLPSRAASGWSKIIPVQAGFDDMMKKHKTMSGWR